MANLPRSTEIASSILHKCGQYLAFTIIIDGEQATAVLKEHRFTFTSYFAKVALHFKAHGTRVTKCPECQKPLPHTVEQWNDADFQQASTPESGVLA